MSTVMQSTIVAKPKNTRPARTPGKLPFEKKQNSAGKEVYVEKGPVALAPAIRKDGYRMYEMAPHVLPEATFCGLLLYYGPSRFTTTSGLEKFAFMLVRPMEMPVPWLSSLERSLAKMIVESSKYSGGRERVAVRRRCVETIRGNLRFWGMNFSGVGPYSYIDEYGAERIADQKRGIPDYTPVRVTVSIGQDSKPKDGLVGIVLSVVGITVVPMPSYLADFARQHEAGIDPKHPPGATECPDGEDLPMDTVMDDLYDVSSVMKSEMIDRMLTNDDDDAEPDMEA